MLGKLDRNAESFFYPTLTVLIKIKISSKCVYYLRRKKTAYCFYFWTRI